MARGKKQKKKPGDIVTWKLRVDESPMIVEWINNQDNIMDSLRFLVEKEIFANGNVNLQLVVPSVRQFNIEEQRSEPSTIYLNNYETPTKVETERPKEHLKVGVETDTEQPQQVTPEKNNLVVSKEIDKSEIPAIEEEKTEEKEAEKGPDFDDDSWI
ncbi:hypothetical protein AWM68_17820 [Fictibacillus phosphorivorans]|uniref:Uncharacterized protein n=1 Tax=Fictibacillus phosphorivorans TaxID=1221500 RepID=A0A163S2Y6_9BACL|nr:hypothetical protein [Fictibacillus phosphorivorans]KZE68028.1 hypothetical protein AWM68_17820 [Fictibacillus phosphorivorans]